MDIKQVKNNTFCIDTGMTCIPFYKIDEHRIIMLDTGWAHGEREGIERLLTDNNLHVAGILCSHAHVDHIGNNTYFREKYNCTIAMPAYEAFICDSAINLKVYYSSQTLTDVAQHFGHMVCETDIKIMDNQEEVCLCGVKFSILHTPGHSPAHICIITPDQVAYLGDALISYEVMAGAKMPYAYILREDLNSKQKLLQLNCSRYILAHKGIYDSITTLIDDNINFYKERAESVYGIIEGSMTMEQILGAAITSMRIPVTSRYRYSVIEKMLRSYVEFLQEEGKLELHVTNGYLRYAKLDLKRGNQADDSVGASSATPFG